MYRSCLSLALLLSFCVGTLKPVVLFVDCTHFECRTCTPLIVCLGSQVQADQRLDSKRTLHSGRSLEEAKTFRGSRRGGQCGEVHSTVYAVESTCRFYTFYSIDYILPTLRSNLLESYRKIFNLYTISGLKGQLELQGIR